MGLQIGGDMNILYTVLLILIAAFQVVNIVLTLIDLHWWKIYEDDLQDDYEMWEERHGDN